MNEGGWAEAATAVRRYHALSKHHPRHYAPGPGGLDWANQPNPFRRFKGSLVVPLPLVSGEGMLAYDHLFRPAEAPGSQLDGPSLGRGSSGGHGGQPEDRIIASVARVSRLM